MAKPKKSVAARVAEKVAEAFTPKPDSVQEATARDPKTCNHDWKLSVPFGDQYQRQCRNCGAVETRKTP